MRADLKNLHNYGFGEDTEGVPNIREREKFRCGRDLISQKKTCIQHVSTRKI